MPKATKPTARMSTSKQPWGMWTKKSETVVIESSSDDEEVNSILSVKTDSEVPVKEIDGSGEARIVEAETSAVSHVRAVRFSTVKRLADGVGQPMPPRTVSYSPASPASSFGHVDYESTAESPTSWTGEGVEEEGDYMALRLLI